MRPLKEKSKCAICLEEGDGFHFGAEACKACTAFFRRSVSQKRIYTCRGANDCDITINIRCMCRACRYSKCLEVGMNPMGVLAKPSPSPSNPSETIQLFLSSLTQTTRASLLTLTLPTSFNDSMPLLSRMRSNYQKLCDARIVLHREEGQSLFEEKAPRALNYQEAVSQSMKDVRLTSDWISWCFDDFVKLPIEEKNNLFRNFYIYYYMMEGAFASHLANKIDAVVLPSGDFLDMTQMETFYESIEVKQPLDKEQIENLFKPSIDYHRKALILPMVAEKLDIYEFFALTALLLWNTTLENITEESAKTGKRVKDQLLKEIGFYLKNVKKVEDPVVRVAKIVNMLPDVYKSTRKIVENVEMTQVFNIYTADKQYYDLFTGNFI
ncbi:hypothetical protein CRE_17355 [Caenorhabditis remanei]|uniref:Uncharacterized protein n=1 Tax=Caenorhabditis remanei TaxID=31234 RepID=E3MS27_CAERE|nr:hypothetical protein CRE_17355 [Caenorhabditis remanei]